MAPHTRLFALAAFLSVALAQSVPATVPATSYPPQKTVPASANLGKHMIVTHQDPDAIDPQDVCPGYKAKDVVRSEYGLTATLILAGKACNVYGTDIESLNLTVQYQSNDRLNVEVVPTFIDASNSSHYILPESLAPKPGIDANSLKDPKESDLSFVWGDDPSFYFSVLRKSTGSILFSTKGSKFIFENQFIEFSSPLPEDYNLYGLGEVIHGLKLGNNLTRTIWASQVGDPIDGYYEVASNGTKTYVPVATNYTSRPDAKYTSMSHGVFLRNIHGQEVLLRPEGITWRTIGGSVDLYFYAGPTAKDVTRSYQHSTTGLPAMQQYWTLGFHQCRWGYQNWTVLEDVIKNYENAGIALETIWTDIDYMNQYRDFTLDPNSWSEEGGRDFLEKLHAGGRHFVPIIDAAIYVPNEANATDAYDTFARGNSSDVFMKNPDGSLYIGSVWPGYTAFPDWLSPKANQWWSDEMSRFSKILDFDGMWIDMTEAASFCVGSCGSGKLTDNPVHPPWSLPGEPGAIDYTYPEGFSFTNASEAAVAASMSSAQEAANSATAGPTPTSTAVYRPTVVPGVRDINYPPYVMNYLPAGHDTAVDAVSNNATHSGGIAEYDVHSLWGHQILNATYHALLDIAPRKRPFIIGRSTLFGSGKWAGHWGGDNYSKWIYMYFSIPQALSFSLFGIPMFGVDTCGFIGNSDAELCNRWMQLSAFFPFYRNHNSLSMISQEAYVWSSVAEATRKAMHIRYSLLPYFYTLMYQAHETGSTVMTALSWEFPNEPILAGADRQFLLGSSIMVTPVLNQGMTTVDAVFPGVAEGTIWYDWYNQTAMDVEANVNTTLAAPLGHIPVFIRGGSVLPMQEPALTTKASRENPWAVLVALDANEVASGSLYIDDGESLVPESSLYVEFTTTNNTLYASGHGNYVDSNALGNVTVLGVAEEVKEVRLNGGVVEGGWKYNAMTKVLHVTGLQDATKGGVYVHDWSLSWL
ncbi:hypothetical protein V494_01348 [Pseudogymnoascus sp. VKM F-4513 (FW-928)]|nr:hypothetical protein V494_01348 [Pseudogymnoascus sp. VKM F-4513 (FW-928)]